MPPEPIRFYLDENIPASIATQLHQKQIDVVCCQDLNMRTAADADHLALATDQNRVLVTFDQDFLRLNSEGRVHCGIAFIIKSLLELYSRRTTEHIRNRVSYISG